MKKFSLNNLTYKDVLIIKHALRDKIFEESGYLCTQILLEGFGYGDRHEDFAKKQKEHDEHERCYKKVEEQVQLIQDYINGKGSCRANQLLL